MSSGAAETKQFSAVCSIAEPTVAGIETAVDTNIISVVSEVIPEWAKEPIHSQLVQQVQDLFVGSRIRGTWDTVPFIRNYFAPDPSVDTIQFKAVVAYCNASVRVEDKDVQIFTAYCTGTFKNAPPPKTIVRNELLTVLCEAANRQLDRPEAIPNPPTPEKLAVILQKLTEKQFQVHFKYPFAGSKTKPKKPSPVASSLIQCTETMYFSIDQEGNIGSFVDDKVIKGLKLPPGTQDDLREYLVTEFSTFAEGRDTDNDWQSQMLQEQFDSTSANSNSIVLNGSLSYTNASLSVLNQNSTQVDISSFYFVGVFYEVVYHDSD